MAGALLRGTLAEVFGARPLPFASSALIDVASVVALFSLRAHGDNRQVADPSHPERRET